MESKESLIKTVSFKKVPFATILHRKVRGTSEKKSEKCLEKDIIVYN